MTSGTFQGGYGVMFIASRRVLKGAGRPHFPSRIVLMVYVCLCVNVVSLPADGRRICGSSLLHGPTGH